MLMFHTIIIIIIKIISVFQRSSQYPAYALSSASVVPGSSGTSVHVVGTSAGTVHLVKSSSIQSKPFSNMDSIPGQVKRQW